MPFLLVPYRRTEFASIPEEVLDIAYMPYLIDMSKLSIFFWFFRSVLEGDVCGEEQTIILHQNRLQHILSPTTGASFNTGEWGEEISGDA